MDFLNMDAGTIEQGVNADGTRYLSLFLKEFQSIFNETVNPGCNKCITQYLERYKKHFNMKTVNDKSGGYKLFEKYEGIPLDGFGSQTFVTNANLTPEYAKVLLGHENGERYFEAMPEDTATKETGDNEPSELQKLEGAIAAAKEKIAGHKPTTQQRFKDADAKKLADAEKAREEYLASNPATDENVNNIDTVVTEDTATKETE